MRKVIPHLWFDKEALEAANFYASLFKNSKILSQFSIKDTPSGDAEMVTISVSGLEIMMISAGPMFKVNPSLSFLVACEDAAEVQAYHFALTDGGAELMPLGAYPFSTCYAWVVDRFGVSWQLMARDERPVAQTITPTLMFVGEQCGRCEDAIRFYTSLFDNAHVLGVDYYGEGMAPNLPHQVKHAAFSINDQWFAAMDSAYEHGFSFNEAMSLIIECESQAEIDFFWEKLSAVPEAEACGWVKDQFGLSWQITPTVMSMLMHADDPVRLARVTKAMLQMKKLDIAGLQRAYDGLE